MRHLVDHDIGIAGAVAVRIRSGPKVHLHTTASAVCTGREVCVVCARRILSLCRDTIGSGAAATKVIVLVVSCELGKPKLIEFVVVPVHYVKLLDDGTSLRFRR